MAKIAVIPGDGAGIEVVAQALRLLELLSDRRRLGLSFIQFDFGADRYLQTGVGLPPGTIEDFRENYDAILFGAVGDARVKGQAHAREILLGLRFGLDLYVNFRPCRLLDERLCPLKGKRRADVDFVVFRENTEGMYNGVGGALKVGTPDEVALAEEVNTRKGVERIIRAAFAWAQAHGKTQVAMVDKSNAIGAHDLWVRVFRLVAAEYPAIRATHAYVDAMAMQMVQAPERLEVIVTTNLFGDILTDLGAALVGGMGVAPSANLNPETTPLFEPVHGSAPDIAGRNLVNPVAMFLSAALMLEHVGHPNEGSLLAQAVEQTVQAGEVTRDLGGTLGTKEASDAVRAALLRLL